METALRKRMMALACAMPSLLCAQAPAEPTAEQAPSGPHEVSRFRDPKDGQIDLIAFLAHPRAFLPIPLVVTEPAVGYGGGVAGMFVRPRKEAGSEGYARPNMSIAGGIATENGTWAAFAGDSSHWKDERLQTLAAVGYGELHLDFYGLAMPRRRSISPSATRWTSLSRCCKATGS